LFKLGVQVRATDLDGFSVYGRRETPEFAPNNVHATTRMSERLLYHAS
jgi:hypothetical protein